MNENFISNHDVKVSESQFTCWSGLPMELKVKVARNLQYPTLRNFMFLSKECMKISSLSRTAVEGVIFWNMHVERNATVQQYATITVIPIGPPKVRKEEYVIDFLSSEDGGCIARRKKKGGQAYVMGPEYPMESCLTVSTRVFLQITKILKAKYVALVALANIVDLKTILSKLPSTSLITCGALIVRALDLSFLPLLMPHVAPGCELRFYNDSIPSEDITLHSAFFDFEVVKAAPLLIIEPVCEINDEQLIHLRASRLYLKAPRILEKGINELILQWMKRRRKICICIATTKTSHYNMVFEENKSETSSSGEHLQIPFSIKYVEQADPLCKRHALVCNGLGDRLSVYLGEDFCELVDPCPASLPQNVTSHQRFQEFKCWGNIYH